MYCIFLDTDAGAVKVVKINNNKPLSLDDDLPHLHGYPYAKHKLQVIYYFSRCVQKLFCMCTFLQISLLL